MNDQHYHGAYTQMGYQRFKQKNSKISMKPLLSNRSIGISDVGIGTYKGSLNC